MRITTELKDKLLNYIINNEDRQQITIDLENLSKEWGVNREDIGMSLRCFEKSGLIKESYGITWSQVCYDLLLACHDLYSLGGFEYLDTILPAQLEKLKLQIEALDKELTPDKKTDKITSIVANTTTIIANVVELTKAYLK